MSGAREDFEARHSVPQEAQYNHQRDVYRYRQYPGVDHPINDLYVAFCNGRESAQRQSGEAVAWRGVLKEMVDAMRQYQMDVEDDPPFRHRDMMERAESLLDSSQPQPAAPEGWELVPVELVETLRSGER